MEMTFCRNDAIPRLMRVSSQPLSTLPSDSPYDVCSHTDDRARWWAAAVQVAASWQSGEEMDSQHTVMVAPPRSLCKNPLAKALLNAYKVSY